MIKFEVAYMDEAERQQLRDIIELKQFLWRHKHNFSLDPSFTIIVIVMCVTISIVSSIFALISMVVLAIYSIFILVLIVRSLFNNEKKILENEIDCLYTKLLNSYESKN